MVFKYALRAKATSVLPRQYLSIQNIMLKHQQQQEENIFIHSLLSGLF